MILTSPRPPSPLGGRVLEVENGRRRGPCLVNHATGWLAAWVWGCGFCEIEVVSRLFQLAGHGEIAMPYVTRCWRTQRPA